MTLTATAVKNAKPGAKTQRLYDERGLYLEISPKGGKWWRFKYRIDGKEKRLSLGVFPDMRFPCQCLLSGRSVRHQLRKLRFDSQTPRRVTVGRYWIGTASPIYGMYQIGEV